MDIPFPNRNLGKRAGDRNLGKSGRGRKLGM